MMLVKRGCAAPALELRHTRDSWRSVGEMTSGVHKDVRDVEVAR